MGWLPPSFAPVGCPGFIPAIDVASRSDLPILVIRTPTVCKTSKPPAPGPVAPIVNRLYRRLAAGLAVECASQASLPHQCYQLIYVSFAGGQPGRYGGYSRLKSVFLCATVSVVKSPSVVASFPYFAINQFTLLLVLLAFFCGHSSRSFCVFSCLGSHFAPPRLCALALNSSPKGVVWPDLALAPARKHPKLCPSG